MVKQTCLTFKRSSDSWADSVAGRQGRVGRIEIQVRSNLDQDQFFALYLVRRTIFMRVKCLSSDGYVHLGGGDFTNFNKREMP